MTLGYYLSLDQLVLFNSNFSDTLKITGTCFSNKNKSTAFDLTGYTLTLRFFRDGGTTDHYNKTVDIVTAASGTWSEAVTTGTLPFEGLYLIDLVLTKSGTQISNLNRVEVLIKRGPSN